MVDRSVEQRLAAAVLQAAPALRVKRRVPSSRILGVVELVPQVLAVHFLPMVVLVYKVI